MIGCRYVQHEVAASGSPPTNACGPHPLLQRFGMRQRQRMTRVRDGSLEYSLRYALLFARCPTRCTTAALEVDVSGLAGSPSMRARARGRSPAATARRTWSARSTTAAATLRAAVAGPRWPRGTQIASPPEPGRFAARCWTIAGVDVADCVLRLDFRGEGHTGVGIENPRVDGSIPFLGTLCRRFRAPRCPGSPSGPGIRRLSAGLLLE